MALAAAAVALALVVAAFAWPLLAPLPDAERQAKRVARATISEEPAPVAPQPKPMPAAKTMPEPPTVKTPAAKPATPPAPAEPKLALAHGYYIQLGAFREGDRAEKLAAKLADWHTHVITRPNGLHAVWAGPHADRATAEGVRKEIAKSAHVSGFVISH